MKFDQLHTIADAIGAGHYKKARKAISGALEGETGPAWHKSLNQLSAFLADPTRAPFAGIMAQGNGKLPFLSFSVLPGVTCPGAGDCLEWCYSFRAWRYPAAFARQAQNTVLIKSAAGRRHILAALDKHECPRLDFRLYVDGDFDSLATAEFWRDTLAARPWLASYGYSKSLSILADVIMPDNYRLNLSSGHNYGEELERKAAALPYARGRFVAVNIGRKVKSADHGARAHQKSLRAVYGKSAFTCPGQCGDCTPTGHACGSDRFKNVDIIIATH